MRNTLLVLVILPVALQGATLTGVVRDSISGEPLVGAVIVITNANIRTHTDTLGCYRILNIPKGQNTVTCHFLGYRTESATISISDSADVEELNFSLSDDARVLSEKSSDLVRSYEKERVALFRDSAEFYNYCFRVDLRRLEGLSDDEYLALASLANELYQIALDSLLPTKNPHGKSVGFRVSWPLCPGFREYSFVLTETYHAGSQAFIFESDSMSLYAQLKLIYLDNPKIPKNQVLSKLKVHHWYFSSDEIPDLDVLMNSVSKVSFQCPEVNDIYLDPLIFEVEVHAASGDMSIRYCMMDDPLVQWAIHTKNRLDAYRHSK